MGPSDLRLAELLAALSLETDLAMGLPAEHAMRACLLATTLARDMGIGEAEVAAIYYTTLLRFVGCTAFSHEEALLLGGDDVAARRAGASVDFTNAREILPVVLGLGRGAPPLRRIRTVTRAMAHGRRLDPPSRRRTARSRRRRLAVSDSPTPPPKPCTRSSSGGTEGASRRVWPASASPCPPASRTSPTSR